MNRPDVLQGFHNITAETYHMDPCARPSLTSSVAKILLRESPLKAWHSHPRLNPEHQEKQDDKFDLGTAAHAALLEDVSSIAVIDPADYPSKTGSIPDGWTNNAIRAARDAARASGLTPLLKRHYDDVRYMVDAARAFIKASEIRDEWFAKDAQSEVTAVCQQDGIWLRCRFDRFAASYSFIGDFKSTTDVTPDGFSRQIGRMNYDVQHAFYRRVARVLGVKAPRFVFVAQNCEAPYECSLHDLHPGMIEIADAKVDRAVKLWRDCIMRNEWPSYSGRIHYTMPTAYQMAEHEMLLEAA